MALRELMPVGVGKSAHHHLSQNEIAGDNPYPVELKFPASSFTQT
jgi:hypothetical protein